MSEDTPVAKETDEAASDTASATDVWARDTAPQTPYTMRQVVTGLVFFAIAAAVAFGLPLALT